VFRKAGNSVLVSIVMSCIACVGRDVENGAQQVSVNVYNDAGVPANVMLRAEQSAGGIFRKAGVHVTWRNCEDMPQNLSSQQACGKTDGVNISIRLIPHSLTLTDSVFGTSFLDEHGSGIYGDIFFDNAQNMSETARVNLGEVLGHVIAHEIGHLLLGRDAHSQTGIMRPHWSKEELQNLAMGRLLFTKEQGRWMTEKLRPGSMLARDSRTGKLEVASGSR
jgi:hypothetical protein